MYVVCRGNVLSDRVNVMYGMPSGSVLHGRVDVMYGMPSGSVLCVSGVGVVYIVPRWICFSFRRFNELYCLPCRFLFPRWWSLLLSMSCWNVFNDTRFSYVYGLSDRYILTGCMV